MKPLDADAGFIAVARFMLGQKRSHAEFCWRYEDPQLACGCGADAWNEAAADALAMQAAGECPLCGGAHPDDLALRRCACCGAAVCAAQLVTEGDLIRGDAVRVFPQAHAREGRVLGQRRTCGPLEVVGRVTLRPARRPDPSGG